MNEVRSIYDRLWDETAPALKRNDVKLDHHLLQKSQDDRRGLSLVIRVQPTVQAAIKKFLPELAAAAPGQYFYQPKEFHITVLAIIPGSQQWQGMIQHLSAFQTFIAEVLKKHQRFFIRFQGVTASRSAVMIQGFPIDDTLARIREELRETLRQNHLGSQLDARYKINAAHITIMRFCDADVDGQKLLALLKASRTVNFGETRVEYLELILGDWYASANTVHTFQKYELRAKRPHVAD